MLRKLRDVRGDITFRITCGLLDYAKSAGVITVKVNALVSFYKEIGYVE